MYPRSSINHQTTSFSAGRAHFCAAISQSKSFFEILLISIFFCWGGGEGGRPNPSLLFANAEFYGQNEGILERINEPPWGRCLQGVDDARWVVVVAVVVD